MLSAECGFQAVAGNFRLGTLLEEDGMGEKAVPPPVMLIARSSSSVMALLMPHTGCNQDTYRRD
jgi:hypothetical protein